MAELTRKEKMILDALKTHPKGADIPMIQDLFPDLQNEEIVEFMNTLSNKNMVDFVRIGETLVFKARDIAEVNKTMGLDQNERLIYNIIRGVGNAGIWIKDIKTKSNMHTQLVNTSIKNLEKKNLIKSIKSVRNPTKKLYMLFDLEPSADITGGAWYTDQEFDLEFIEALSKQCYKYIHAKTFPPKKPNSIYPTTHNFLTAKDIHSFIRKSGITPVELSLDDIKQLLNRLLFDGKIYKRLKVGYGTSYDDQEYALPKTAGNKRMKQEDEGYYNDSLAETTKKKSKRRRIVSFEDTEKEEPSEQVLGYIGHSGLNEYQTAAGDEDDSIFMYKMEVEDDDAWVYLAVNGESETQAISSIPCGKCPVFNFCSIDGPVNPMNCVYYDQWLQF